MALYCGWVRIERTIEDGTRELVHGPHQFKTDAASDLEADQKIQAEARRRLKPRPSKGESLVVEDIELLERSRPRFYAFRYDTEPGPGSARRAHSAKEYQPGQLVFSYSNEVRDAWVMDGKREQENRQTVLAAKLPAGWRKRDAIDLATGCLAR